MMRRALLSISVAVGVTAAAVVVLSSPGFAQDFSAVTDRLERLERTLSDLQRTVYNGAPPPATDTVSNAAALETAPNVLARIELRLQAVESQMRELTGRVEESGFRVEQIEKRLDVLQSDTAFRLEQLEGGAPLSTSDAGAETVSGAVAGTNTAPTSGGSAALPVGTSGTLSQSEAAGAGQAASLPPADGGSPETLYDNAFQFLARKDFAGAESAFRQFLETYPGDPLAGNAQFGSAKPFMCGNGMRMRPSRS